MRKEIQTQLEKSRVDWLQKNEETKQDVGKIAGGLEELTKALNAFKPASAASMGDVQKQFSEQFNQRLSLQSTRMDVLSESVEKQQKATKDKAQLLQNLMIGIENLGDNMKNIPKCDERLGISSEVQEAEEEYAHLQEELQQEVPLFVPASKGPENAPVSTPEDLNSFPAQRQNIFPIGSLERIPATSTAQE